MDSINGGIDTTARTVLFALYHLGQNPEVQAKVRAEAFSELGASGPVEHTHITHGLKYLRATVRESMRVLPITPMQTRTVPKDIELLGIRIPKGTHIIANSYAMGHDPRFMRDPEAFRPERWLAKGEEKANGNTWMTFGHGCVCPRR